MKFNHFVGIDVSKNTLDLYVQDEHERGQSFVCENNKKSIKDLLRKLRRLPGFNLKATIFCMEFTGIYNNLIVECLLTVKASIWLESALRIKQSQGMLRGKTDKVDAQRIANYAFTHQSKTTLWQPARESLLILRRLLTNRERLVNVIKQLKTPIKEGISFQSTKTTQEEAKMFKASLTALEKDLKGIEKRIKELITQDPRLNELSKLITSVHGVGTVIAANILVTTNEFKSISDPSKFACYAGVAPFAHRSGISIRGRSRVSHLANKKIKTLLHLAAITTLKMKGDIREYYERKIMEGKNKMCIINAIRNKIIRRIFAVIKRGTPFEKNYPLALG